jgi:U3 small nucleolar RNA-associated protein MPP10
VAEMLSGDNDDDDDEDDDDVDFQSEDESGSEDEEDQEEGSDNGHSSGDSDSDSNDRDSEDKDGGEKTMSRLSGDLFDDGFSEDGSDSNDSDQGKAEEDLSRHAKKMKSLSKQIAQLEAENVAKKEWMMKGEAASKDRPQNSLLEEVLEFEHIQKIAPAVTEEKTQNLESLIKQRILEVSKGLLH